MRHNLSMFLLQPVRTLITMELKNFRPQSTENMDHQRLSSGLSCNLNRTERAQMGNGMSRLQMRKHVRAHQDNNSSMRITSLTRGISLFVFERIWLTNL